MNLFVPWFWGGKKEKITLDARLVGGQTFHADAVDGDRRVIAVVMAVGYWRSTLMSAATASDGRRRRSKEALESLSELGRRVGEVNSALSRLYNSISSLPGDSCRSRWQNWLGKRVKWRNWWRGWGRWWRRSRALSSREKRRRCARRWGRPAVSRRRGNKKQRRWASASCSWNPSVSGIRSPSGSPWRACRVSAGRCAERRTAGRWARPARRTAPGGRRRRGTKSTGCSRPPDGRIGYVTSWGGKPIFRIGYLTENVVHPIGFVFAARRHFFTVPADFHRQVDLRWKKTETFNLFFPFPSQISASREQWRNDVESCAVASGHSLLDGESISFVQWHIAAGPSAMMPDRRGLDSPELTFTSAFFFLLWRRYFTI